MEAKNVRRCWCLTPKMHTFLNILGGNFFFRVILFLSLFRRKTFKATGHAEGSFIQQTGFAGLMHSGGHPDRDSEANTPPFLPSWCFCATEKVVAEAGIFWVMRNERRQGQSGGSRTDDGAIQRDNEKWGRRTGG